MSQALLAAAIVRAGQVHANQVDQAGEPYLLHVMRVMLKVAEWDIDAKIVAVLHDVIEEGGTVQDLGLNTDHLCALDAMTRRASESYDAYIERVAQNFLATKVKLLDLWDNADEARLARLPPDVAIRLRAKYSRAMDRLWGSGIQP